MFGIELIHKNKYGVNCKTFFQITVSYGKEDSGIPILQDSVTVSTYSRLQLLHPKTAEIILAVGTSMNVVFRGGPIRQIGKKSSSLKRTITSNNDAVEATDESATYPGMQVCNIFIHV